MPDSTPKDSDEEPTQDSIDLSDLKSFSFGTQWTAASKSSSEAGGQRPNRGGPRGGDRPDRRPKSSGPPRKDRRPQRPTREGGGAPDGSPGHSQAGNEGQGEQGRRQFRRGGRSESPRVPFQPYDSPVFDICFYPDDNCFSAIIKAMRSNHLTYELFHVAKLFMEKPDRFIASITRKALEGQKPEKVFICAVDNMPFATEEEAISHAMTHYAAEFFLVEEVEVDAPTGNFPFVSRCPFTKVLLGPPNYHKYESALRNHHLTRLPNMSFEKLQSSIETVRDEEVVAEWLESQKKATRYTAKDVAEDAEPKVFLSAEAALTHLRGELKSKVAKQVNYARVSGQILEKFRETESFKAMDGERQRQQRFPLDTANAIRGRMRREKFSIYKKGAKGVTYVCSTKRNFRAPGQVMSPDLDRIIRFLEANQGVKSKEMYPIFEAWVKSENADATLDDKKVLRDLHWLIADGYVSHFEDDSLFAQPVLESGTKAEESAPKKPKAKLKETAATQPDSEEKAPVKNPDPVSDSEAVVASSEEPQVPEVETVDETPAEEQEAVEVKVPSQDETVAAEEPPAEPASKDPTEGVAEKKAASLESEAEVEGDSTEVKDTEKSGD